MFSKNLKLRIGVLLLALGLVAVVPAFAGSAVIGSVAGSSNATVGGQPLLPNATIFSGDSLRVKDGAAVIAIGGGSRMVFGRETVASFVRESDAVTVVLEQGNISMFHPGSAVLVRVKAAGVSIVPASGFKTLGEIAMINGAMVVSTKEGLLRVEGTGSSVEVAKGKSITVRPRAARAPAAGGVYGAGIGLGVVNLAASVVSVVFSWVALDRAGAARDASAAAQTSAALAVTAANTAATNAAAATTAATAARAAANNVCNAISRAVPCKPL